MKPHGLLIAVVLFVLLIPPVVDQVPAGEPARREEQEVAVGVALPSAAQSPAEPCLAGDTWPQSISPWWTMEAVDVPKMFLQMRDNSLAVDADNHPHIAYGGDRLYYAHYEGTGLGLLQGWQIETVDASAAAGIYASLVLDAAGRPHIGYYDRANSHLKYAYYDGVDWQIQIVDPHDGMS